MFYYDYLPDKWSEGTEAVRCFYMHVWSRQQRIKSLKMVVETLHKHKYSYFYTLNPFLKLLSFLIPRICWICVQYMRLMLMNYLLIVHYSVNLLLALIRVREIGFVSFQGLDKLSNPVTWKKWHHNFFFKENIQF